MLSAFLWRDHLWIVKSYISYFLLTMSTHSSWIGQTDWCNTLTLGSILLFCFVFSPSIISSICSWPEAPKFWQKYWILYFKNQNIKPGLVTTLLWVYYSNMQWWYSFLPTSKHFEKINDTKCTKHSQILRKITQYKLLILFLRTLIMLLGISVRQNLILMTQADHFGKPWLHHNKIA